MSELDEVAELLEKKTTEGKLKWNLEGEFRVTTRQRNNIVELTQNGRDVYTLSIRNYDGILLTQETFVESASRNFPVLRNIFLKARRASLGVDKAIFDIKESLLHL